MRFNIFISFAILLLSLNVSLTSAQTKSAEYSNEVVAEVGKEKITAQDLLNAYQKNLSRKHENLFASPKDSIYDFLNLFINFRLKVNDALGRGYDQDSSVISETKQNRKILAESFYFEKKLSEPYVDHLLKQREKEYLVSLILFPLQYNAATQIADTTEAYRKANDAFAKIKNGENFADVAKKYSEDPETAKRGGLIPNYMTSGKVQRPIEEAIFSTPAGSFYPELVKTQYGYFILKVNEVAERKLVKASQILIAINDTRDSASAYKKADSLLKLIHSGKDFGKLAKDNSDDKVTAEKNGDLTDYYSRSTGLETGNNQLVAEFEKSLFSLKDGEISKPIKSEFGFHIIKRLSTKSPDFEKERSDLRKIYKRLYFEDDKKKLMEDLAKSLNFHVNDQVFNSFIASLDSNATTLKEGWDKNVPQNLLNQNIYSINNESKDVSFLIGKLNKEVELRGIATNKDGINKALNIIIEPTVFENATKNMEKEYSDFNQLMKEFKDGILLFKVEAQEVWDKMKFDSTMAKKYFDTLTKKFYTDDMYDFTEIFILNDSVAKTIYQRVKYGEDFNKVASVETQRDNYREKRGEWGYMSAKLNHIAKYIHEQKAKPGTILPPFKSGTGFSIVRVNGYQAPRAKVFNEAISDIAPMYQELLQKNLTTNWLNGAKKKYPVKINEKVISDLMKKSK